MALGDPGAADAFEKYLEVAGNDPGQVRWVKGAQDSLNRLRAPRKE